MHEVAYANICVTVVENNGALPFRTCMSYGPNYYRTFDGLEFLFRGRCAYTVFSDGVISVTVELINCHSYHHCEKVSIWM